MIAERLLAVLLFSSLVGNVDQVEAKDWKDDLLNHWVKFQSFNYNTHYIRHKNFRAVIEPLETDLDHKDATFKVVEGLDPRTVKGSDATIHGGAVSFESLNYPGHFLRHLNQKLELGKRPEDSTDLAQFARDATFIISDTIMSRQDSGYPNGCSSIVAINYLVLPRDRWFRHRDFKVNVENPDNSELFRKDATFCIEDLTLKIAKEESAEGVTIEPDNLTIEPDNLKGVTALHNQIRRNVSEGKPLFHDIDDAEEQVAQPRPEQKLSSLLWSLKLANMAKEHVSRCHFEHTFEKHNYRYGENLNVDSNPSRNSDWYLSAIKRWAEEAENYNITNNTCAPRQLCSHYLQIATAGVSELGCAIQDCPSGYSTYDGNYQKPVKMLFCMYDHPMGMPPYSTAPG